MYLKGQIRARRKNTPPTAMARDLTCRPTHWLKPQKRKIDMAEMAGNINRPCKASLVRLVQRISPAITMATQRAGIQRTGEANAFFRRNPPRSIPPIPSRIMASKTL